MVFYAPKYEKVTIDRTGRVIISKPLREALRLEPGDGLEVNISAKEITLRPV
jgi:AbrB family looped-hinge helix DNA binding protein